MIPKIIHYCWFGGNEKPKLFKKCYKSWKKYCPDYEIIEWNESNFDLNCCQYVKEAYEAKKWAFVSDYVRVWALHNYGGIYLDTDVEVTKNLDGFLCHSAFTGFESEKYPFTAVFGCEKKHSITEKVMKSYLDRKFKLDDNSYDMMTNTELVTSILVKEYKVLLNNQTQIFDDGLVIYSNDYFCPRDYQNLSLNITANTHAIHWFSASWHTEEENKNHKKLIQKIKRLERIDFLKHIPNMAAKKIIGDSLYNKIKKKIKGDFNA